MVEMIAADGEGIAVAAEHKHMQIRAADEMPLANGSARPWI